MYWVVTYCSSVLSLRCFAPYSYGMGCRFAVDLVRQQRHFLRRVSIDDTFFRRVSVERAVINGALLCLLLVEHKEPFGTLSRD